MCTQQDLQFHFFGFPRSSFLCVVAPHERWYKVSGHAVHKLAYWDHQKILLSSSDIQSLFYSNITQNSHTHSKQLSSMISHLHWPQTPPFTGLQITFTIISWVLFTPNIDIIHSYLSDTSSLSVKPEIGVTKTVLFGFGLRFKMT